MASSSSSSTARSSEELTLTVKWSGKEYTVQVCGDDSVAELKRRICELTNVLPKRQKLLYPKIGNKLADDSVLLSQLPLKSSLKMTMIGFVSIFFSLIWFKFYFSFYALSFLKNKCCTHFSNLGQYYDGILTISYNCEIKRINSKYELGNIWLLSSL